MSWLLPLLPLLLCGAAGAQTIVVKPADTVRVGEALSISIEGLPANAEFNVQATRQVREFNGQLRPYSSSARFTSTAAGRIDLDTQAPSQGSYQRADVRGLFWSMTPASPPADEVPPEGQVKLRVWRGGEPMAARTITLQRALPTVATRQAGDFVGAVFASLPGDGRRPALIILGGSEGGAAISREAPLWASRGFAVMSLPYYSPPGWGAAGPTAPEFPSLPSSFVDIPLERLQAARDWLAAQPEVDASRIGVMGTSKGAEFVLAAATRMPWIRSVVALVPSDVIWEGWGFGVPSGKSSSFSWRGQPLPFVPYKDFDLEWANMQRGEPVLVRRPQDKGRAAHPERVAPARIVVEDIVAPVMVVGAHDDQMWDSGGMAEAIAATRRKAGRDTVALVFREGGHALGGTGLNPTTAYNSGPMRMGGTPETTARAQAVVFPQVLAFLQRTLGPLP